MGDDEAPGGAREGAGEEERLGAADLSEAQADLHPARHAGEQEDGEADAETAGEALAEDATRETRAEADKEGDAERGCCGADAVAAPAHHRAERHQGDDAEHDGAEGDVEIGRADGDLVAGERVDHQRIEGAEEDDGGGDQQQEVVAEDGAFAAGGGEAGRLLELAGAQGVERERAAGWPRGPSPG